VVLPPSSAVGHSQTVLTPANCYRLIEEFPDGIISLANICEKTKVPHRVLDAEGRAALAFGVTRKYFVTVTFKLPGGKTQTVLGFPLVSGDVAYKVDGTQPFSATDQGDRFERGPRWRNNSCAIDCVLLVMLMLDMGRCRADQVSEDLLREIHTPLSQTALSVIKKPWSLLLTREITQLRDVVRTELAAFNDVRYRTGGLHGVVSMFDDLTASVAQCQATWATISRCCAAGGWNFKTHSNGQVKATRTGLHIPLELTPQMEQAETFQATIQLLLGPFPDRSKRASTLHCAKCKGSGPAPEQMRIIVDRPPPTLKFSDFNMKGPNGYGKEGMYEDLVVTFQGTTSTGAVEGVAVRYACWGCIFCVNGNHFVVVVNRAARSGGSDFVFYDGRIREALQPIAGSFLDFARRDNFLLGLMLYVQRV
jgi:hypothetical protein